MRPFGCSAAGGFARVLVSVLAVGAVVLGMLIGLAGAETFMLGDVFVGVGNVRGQTGKIQWYRPDTNPPRLIDALDTRLDGFVTGMAFDPIRCLDSDLTKPCLYVTNFSENRVTTFNRTGGFTGTFGGSFNCEPESVVFDKFGNIYISQAGCSKNILKFDRAGNLLARYNVATEVKGADWIDLTYDPLKCELFYTSEGTQVKRFDAITNTQLLDFNINNPLPNSDSRGLVLLPPPPPPLPPDGGILVADKDLIVRLDEFGARRLPDYGVGLGAFWFGLALDPDGVHFWAADYNNGKVYKFNIASGAPALPDPIDTRTGALTVSGVAVYFGGQALPKGSACGSPIQPPPSGPSEGRMTGGGSIFTTPGGLRVTHGFELHCDKSKGPNNLEVNWGSSNKFSLETLTAAVCDSTGSSPKPPAAGFDRYRGEGVGRLNGVSGATAKWTFTDAGEPGTNDFAEFVITVGPDIRLSVSGNLVKGDQQAHAN